MLKGRKTTPLYFCHLIVAHLKLVLVGHKGIKSGWCSIFTPSLQEHTETKRIKSKNHCGVYSELAFKQTVVECSS